ncbi:MAG TPA: transglycosylase domain-containing protein [Candidatus Saccharimonadales bacterium]
MSAYRGFDLESAKRWLNEHSKRAVSKAKATKVGLSRLVGNGRKIKAKDTTANLKQYANLTKRGRAKRLGLTKSESRRRKRAEYLASLPKHPLKRWAYRLHPKRFFKYWFSRTGGIMALKVAGIGFTVAAVGVISLFAYFRKDLPDPRNITFEQAARVYDRTGKTLLYTYGSDSQVRVLVEFDQISNYAKWATIAIEDKDFYHHGGFSVTGVTRAALNNILSPSDETQGGSTITQQFIKNALVGSDRTLTRKVKELILAIELERLYSKDEILSFYLNQIPYGALEYGVEAAANGFFNKSAKNLTIDEAALIAALPQAPSFYSPYGQNTDDLIGRAHYVIDQMVNQGYITSQEGDEAKGEDTLKKVVPLSKRSAYRNIKAPHFVLKVIDDLVREYGQGTVTKGGLRIVTTIDLKAQKLAEDAIKHRYNQGGAMGDNAALVAEDTKSGQVIAYVGSRDFNYKNYGVYDAATPEIGRQPGSSFKPYAYAEMFKNPRWSPGSIIWDSATNFNGYAPHDFDFRFPGPMRVREAIGRSRNIPAVKALYIAGVDNVIKEAQAMGLKSLCDTCDYGLSLVLGAGEVKVSEHVHGFGTFGRGGVYKPQTYVLKIENGQGEILKEWKDDEGEQVIDPQIAYLITSILTDDQARAGTFGLGSNLVVPGYTVGAKTGTTDLSVDGWMMGYSQHVTAGVWVGNHDSKPMYTFVEPMVGPIWNEFMRNYHKGKKDVPFERPEGIKNVKIDRATGRNAGPNSKNVINDIAASWFEGVPASDNEKVTIDTVSNKLATDCTPELAKKVVSNTGAAPELPADDPMFAAWAKGAGYSANTTKIKDKDDVHDCDDSPPNITSFSVVSSDFSVDYTAGTHPLNDGKVNFYVNGELVKTCTIPASGCSTNSAQYTYNKSFSGTVRVEVVDKLLYSDEATENTSFQGITINIDSMNSCGGGDCDVDLSWNAIGGTVNYRLCGFPGGCKNLGPVASFSDEVDHGDYTVTVEARSAGNQLLATGSRDIEVDN